MAQRCNRCCLYQTMRVVNLIVNLFGIGMIIYSLWLQKMWHEGVAKLFSPSALPRPWFIDACLGVGIAVCLSTLVGYKVANCISKSTLCIYIISLCCLLFLQVGVIVTIFFKIDWESVYFLHHVIISTQYYMHKSLRKQEIQEIAKYIDEDHIKFNNFVKIHLMICRLIVIMAVVAQIKVVVLATILLAIGTEPSTESHGFVRPNFLQSFLVVSNPSLPIA